MKTTINVTDDELLWLSLDHLYHCTMRTLAMCSNDLSEKEREAYQNFVDARDAVLDAYQKLGDALTPHTKGAA